MKNVRLRNTAPSVGETLKVSYDVRNVSGKTVRVPTEQNFYQAMNHWIERLGDDAVISVMPKNIARNGRRYAATDFIIKVPTKSPLAPNGTVSFVKIHETKGYPPGRYRFFVEFHDSAGKVLQTEQVEFELKPSE